MRIKLALAALLSTIMCGSAEAATYTLVSPNTFASFSFDYDGHITSQQTITNFTSAVNVTSAEFCFEGQSCGVNGSYVPVQEGIYVSNGEVGTIFDFANGTFENDGVHQALILNAGSHPGTLSVSPALSAVPEAASWVMMILGMGAIGFAMRRRQSFTPWASYRV